MERYRTTYPKDDAPIIVGDSEFFGVDEYSAGENVAPGYCQAAVNIDFTSRDANTRGGFVCLPELGSAPFEAGQSWTARVSAADKDWRGIAYGNGIFVAVANNGGSDDVMYSSDGVTWTGVSSGITNQWTSITYGNGVFVAVAESGVGNRVMTSVNGATWTARTSAGDFAWSSVTYGDGLFVAVAGGGSGTTQVMTSPTGTTWTIRNTPASQADFTWACVAYGNNTFVAVASTSGTGNRAMTSPDGITWTARNTANDYQWFGLAFGGTKFVAVAYNGIAEACMTSEDGITWTERVTPTDSWRNVTYGNALFVAVSALGVAATAVMTSPDGITWTQASGANANQWFNVINGNNTFVAVSNTGTGNRVMTLGATSSVLGSGTYSDPNDAGSRWTMLVGPTSVGFYAFGKTSHTVAINSAYTVTEASTVVQCNNLVYIFRGSDSTPLYWTGNWGDEFTIAPTPTPGAGFSIIPNSNQATYYQNRLWVVDGKDTVAASDILDFQAFDDLANAFNLNTGDSDFLVTTYPFGLETLLVFKNRSILALQNVAGALSDVVVTEITRQQGAIGINAVVSVGPDVAYMSDRNVNLLTLTSTSNAIQHKTLPLSAPIRRTFSRVNWNAANKVSMAYFDNKLFVALPLDNATVCNSVLVYNFITESWFGEWNFADELGMAIQGWTIGNYLGSQRLHCITEDGRIFVTDDGQNDISGTTVSEIATSVTTRAYPANGDNRLNRRMWADIASNRPEFSVTAYVEGASESQQLLTDRTYTRSQSWIANDSTYTMSNANDDYNRRGRKDYATGWDSIQFGTGILPEMRQEYRYPLITRQRGRLVWYQVENTQGFLSLQAVGGEARTGDRNSYVQAL